MKTFFLIFLLTFAIDGSANAITPSREGGELSHPSGGERSQGNTNFVNSSSPLKSTGDKGESLSQNPNQKLSTPLGGSNKSEELHPTSNNPN